MPAARINWVRYPTLWQTEYAFKRSNDVGSDFQEICLTIQHHGSQLSRPSWTPCERDFCLVEVRGLTMRLFQIRCRTARDLDLLILSRAPGSAPGTMTCSRSGCSMSDAFRPLRVRDVLLARRMR